MTVEQQRYLESCKKVLDGERMEIIAMALDYGLQIPEIRKVVQGNFDAACMREVVSGMMEGISEEALDFLCENEFNRYQIREIVEGFVCGLGMEQVQTYAAAEMSASRMRQMRRQLEESAQPLKPGKAEEEAVVREYMKGLMEAMEASARQFRESNERFDALSALVKEHVVDEKNREIQELYENLRYKDQTIQQLQQKLTEREKRITELEIVLEKKSEVQAADQYQGRPEVPQGKPEVLRSRPSLTIPADGKEGMEIREAEDYQRLKRRMVSWLAFWNRGKKKDIFEKVMESDLSPQQLEEVCKCLECGLTDEEIGSIIENDPSPEKIKKVREILLLMRKRKGGSGDVCCT